MKQYKHKFVFIALCSIYQSTNAQTDFPALEQQFIDYRKADKQDSALITARKMNQLALKEQSDTSFWYALSMRYQGNPYYNQGNYDSTLYYWKKSVDLFEKYHPNHSLYASSLNNLGVLYSDMGDYKAAAPYYEQALEIRKQSLGENHPDYASSLNNLGILYKDMGDYKAAAPYCEQALEIYKQSLGENHPDYASSLNSLGNLYSDMGDYKAAAPYYEQALEIKKQSLGEEHPDYAMSLNNLGVLYSDMGDYKAAATYFEQALAIRRQALGEDHPDYASSLNNLGVLYKSMGDYKAAATYYEQALKIYKQVLGKEHPDYAMSLNHLGILFYDMGDYETAAPYYEQALEIKKQSLGEDHPDYIQANLNYAQLLRKMNRQDTAFRIYQIIFSQIAGYIANNFEWLSEKQRESYWEKEQDFFLNIPDFAVTYAKEIPAVTELNYNALLLVKSKLLEANLSKNRSMMNLQDSAVNTIYEKLKFKRRYIAKLESEGNTNRDLIVRLHQEADSLDRLLMKQWGAYEQEKKHLLVKWNEVQSALSNEEVAIEFNRYYDTKDSCLRYQALLIKDKIPHPIAVRLCKEEDLQNILVKSGFSQFYNLIWQPLLPHLEGIKTVYYAPDGLIANIPIHALYESNDTASLNIQSPQTLVTASRGVKYNEPTQNVKKEVTYVMDRFELHQLTSTRYLALGLKEQAKQTIDPSLVGFGGLDYDYLPNSPKAQVNKSSWASRMFIKKSIAMRSSGYADDKLLYLPGTQKEIQDITNTAATSGWKVDYFTGGEGTEKRISELEGSQSPGVLHIASHGYAFPEYSEKDTTLKKQSLRYTFRYSKNPMVRSGLIMTGGNWAWLGSDTLKKLQLDEDGILTALEVSQLNLLHTKLVVLSACETGLGAIDPTEGVFGLKRAFKLAGAESLVLSLWSVPDDKTQELMGLFYQELTRSKLPVPSFAIAQKIMRDRYPTDPISWAGFVLVR